MSQPIRLQSLVASPAAGFEQPFEMLEACHERVQRMLALLARLRAHVRENGADVQAQQAARDVMRYFDIAAPHHHRDEELHVFPRLLREADPEVVPVVERLQRDHLRMEQCWVEARSVLERVARAEADRFSAADDEALDAFAGLYGEHLAAEERIAYPRARALMDESEIEAAGKEMMRRRGVTS
ncbi:MAG TPA: hemerythrin domain-containing protein [Ramlibacter sp.]|uniref:hemerythrin domain-containing protein n=1 Tax=Ramlibacter sp. TaxID=1917967 RepID=UPI002ED3D817